MNAQAAGLEDSRSPIAPGIKRQVVLFTQVCGKVKEAEWITQNGSIGLCATARSADMVCKGLDFCASQAKRDLSESGQRIKDVHS